MERIERFGDPHALLDVEDHVVLKMETPWPRDAPLPRGCSLGDDSGSLLVTSRQSLVAARRILRRTRISGALFAGCIAFNSSHSFETVARDILRDAEEVCIVHNKDMVWNLIRMFPNVKVLALPHDFGMHAVECAEPCRGHRAPLVESSELRQLVGSIEGGDDDCLILSLETVRAILLTCPLLCRIDSVHILEASVKQGCPAAPAVRSEMSGFTHLTLVTSPVSHRCGQEGMATVEDVFRAAKTYTHVEHLMVVITSREALVAVSSFRNLRSLSLQVGPPLHPTEVNSTLQQVLKTWPQLEKLSLRFFNGLRLTAIARLCPHLKSLILVDCEGPVDEVALGLDAFPSLEVVKLGMGLSALCFESLLLSTSGRLRRLHLLSRGGARYFLKLCTIRRGRMLFPRLQELTLRTDLTVPKLGLEPEDLHHVMRALPALRRLVTDSYDVRLFFENYSVPRDRVSLSWCTCVHCVAHDKLFYYRRALENLCTPPCMHHD